jgi:hypothetical protein
VLDRTRTAGGGRRRWIPFPDKPAARHSFEKLRFFDLVVHVDGMRQCAQPRRAELAQPSADGCSAMTAGAFNRSQAVLLLRENGGRSSVPTDGT